MQWHQLSKQEDRGYMNNIKALVAKYGINFMIDEIYKDPEKGARKIIDWADRFTKSTALCRCPRRWSLEVRDKR